MFLKQTLQAGNLALKNRLVMPPMATRQPDEGGFVSQGLLDYYNEKTKDGCLSLVIIEHSFVSQAGKAHKSQLSAADDSKIQGLKKLSQLIHQNGSKTVMQLNHAGSAAEQSVTGTEPVGPSPVQLPSKKDAAVPKELSVEEIHTIVSQFASAALRVKEAGFDGVEIHSAHGYLLDQFLSPITNLRKDEYGGPIENRVRIHLEVIKAVREAVGADFPILLRMGATDADENGLSEADAKQAAGLFEQAGVCLLDISGGMCRYQIPGVSGPGFFAPISKAIKQTVSVPVLVTGGITEPEQAETILQSGSADLVGVGRAILKDSSWAKKAMQEE